VAAAVAFVLAAGLGTRMRSRVPKVMHPIAGRPLLGHVLAAVAEVGASPVVVLSRESDAARAILPAGTAVAVQDPPRGTGDAVRAGLAACAEASAVAFIVYGDTPLLSAATLKRLREALTGGAVLAVLTADVGLDNSYGRLVRGRDGSAERIVEARVATPAEREIPESAAFGYAADLAWLRSAVPRLLPNATGEIFLTDLVALARAEGRRVAAHKTAAAEEVQGINTRIELAAAEALMRRRIRERHMLAGVTFRDPESSSVDAEVALGEDVVVERGSLLEGRTTVGAGSRIGPYSILRDSTVGERCVVEASVVEGSVLEDDVRIGPFGHLRPGAHLESGVELGNFGEVKAARLGRGTKMHHFSYVGDASVGERVNIGAGTITLNYDGANKSRTEIGDDAFIGSDSLLRAPIKVGKGAATGAGALVTKDVPDGMLSVGMPARAIKKYEKPKRR